MSSESVVVILLGRMTARLVLSVIPVHAEQTPTVIVEFEEFSPSVQGTMKSGQPHRYAHFFYGHGEGDAGLLAITTLTICAVGSPCEY